MGSDFGSFFNQGNFQIEIFLTGQLHQLDGTRQAGRSAADKQYIKINTLTLYSHLVHSYLF